jgi:amino-acid N-acetyltransferase
MTKGNTQFFIESFRHSAPYIHAHRDRTFVLVFGGEAVDDPGFSDLVHDIALMHSLGIRLVLVHGTRPQIEARLKARGAAFEYANGLRITDDIALECVKEAGGVVRVEIEALLSMGLANTPMYGARIAVSSGNFVTARPVGIRDGVDFCHTGEVRRIDAAAIQAHLDNQRIVLLSPLGYSPTGEVFNLSAGEVATATAIALQADKLIMLSEGHELKDSNKRLVHQLSRKEAGALLVKPKLPVDTRMLLQRAIEACDHGVLRIHLVNRQTPGALLLELFTRDGSGTLVTAGDYEGLRDAAIEHVGGILELIRPLEQEGTLVKHSRERLELEINNFMVIERDGTIIGCAALYPAGKKGLAELACLAVHSDYQKQGRGDVLLQAIENRASGLGITRLFVLTTRTAHWFQERGFLPGGKSDLPQSRKQLYNFQRNSKVFYKQLG